MLDVFMAHKAKQLSPKTDQSFDETFKARGKILLSGEYLALYGARCLALPSALGQELKVRYKNSFAPKLVWKSYDYLGKTWFEGEFELWRFKALSSTDEKVASKLTQLFQAVRKQDPHFLRDENLEIQANSYLEFPEKWGLGSSSTLVALLAQWARISPFQLQFDTFQGSGYDVACAQSDGPLIYSRKGREITWRPINFRPSFLNQLHFVYLGRKQDTQEEVGRFLGLRGPFGPQVKRVNELAEKMLSAVDLCSFSSAIEEHEQIISSIIGRPTLKESRFSDFNGHLKSLGAWGGDFALATGDSEYIASYFASKGLDICIPFSKLVCLNHNYQDGTHPVSYQAQTVFNMAKQEVFRP